MFNKNSFLQFNIVFFFIPMMLIKIKVNTNVLIRFMQQEYKVTSGKNV